MHKFWAISCCSVAQCAVHFFWQDRPLSARERRRLRQSQESVSGAGSESKNFKNVLKPSIHKHSNTCFLLLSCTAICIAPQSSYDMHTSTQGDQCSHPVSSSLSGVIPETCKEVVTSLISLMWKYL